MWTDLAPTAMSFKFQGSRPIALLLAVPVALAILPASAFAARVMGPDRVTAGKVSTFRASGFPARVKLTVDLQLTRCRGSNGCAAGGGSFRGDRRGSARVRFRWPSGYYICGSASQCTRYDWPDGGAVDVDVCAVRDGEALGCARKVVRVRS